MWDMHFFPCPKCSGKCFPADGLKCLNCDSTTGNIMNDNFQQKQPEIAVSGETNAASGSRILLDQNSMPLITTDLVPNRKRNKSNDQIIKKSIQLYEQDIEKIRKKTDRNRHLMQETRTATNRMPPGNRHSIDIRKAFLNNEPLWNIGKFQVSQKNNAQVKILDPKESLVESVLSGEETFAIPGPSGFHESQNVPNLLGEEFHFINTSEILSTSLRRNPEIFPCQSSDPNESLGESVFSVDDTFAIPGPSGFHESQNVPNLLGEELNFSNTSEIRPTFLRKNLEIFPCDICSEDIDKHTKRKSRRNHYSCCACKYETNKPDNLQVHIQIHCAKNDCSVCSKEYTNATLHDGEQICKVRIRNEYVCGKTFQYRTELDEHLLDHEDYFLTHCWGCSLSLNKHSIKKEVVEIFYCCVCGYKTIYNFVFQSHNLNHRPKLFCKICREEYPEKEKDLHDSKYACIKCKIEFKCFPQFEDHYEESSHILDLCKYCRHCIKMIDEHLIERVGKNYFKCCAYKCPLEFELINDFHHHLHSHPGLGFYKCGICRKRYQSERSLSNHSKSCILLVH